VPFCAPIGMAMFVFFSVDTALLAMFMAIF
jgi:hypothetical protein